MIIMKRKFGDIKSPLLLSVRSGARQSMPGMMETVLNVGLTEETIPGLIKLFKDERFVYDAYRRLIMMYADVVMEKSEGLIISKGSLSIRQELELIMETMKMNHNISCDSEFTISQLKEMSLLFKKFSTVKMSIFVYLTPWKWTFRHRMQFAFFISIKSKWFKK